MFAPPKFLIRAWRAIAGALFGAGLSSLAEAASASPSFGPREVAIFGQPIPVLSALFGLAGVVLARRVAPIDPTSERLGLVGNAALTMLLALGVLAFVIAGEKRPIVALSWAIGLGYSGNAFIALVAQGVRRFAGTFIETILRSARGTGGGETSAPLDQEEGL